MISAAFKYVSHSAATTFAFPSVFIVILCMFVYNLTLLCIYSPPFPFLLMAICTKDIIKCFLEM